MIRRTQLLSDLQSVLRQLETDLIQRSTSPDVPEVGAWLQAEFKKASDAKRTAQNYTDWLNDYATQVAAAWVLSCVFARFLEDNGLYETPMIAGSANHLQRAKDERELYFRQHPGLTDRDYLLHVFQTLRDLKGGVVNEVFGGHNPVNELPNWLGPDAAGVLLRFFQRIDPDTGGIHHDFTDPNWDTRFLGDLYQDLSEAARKKYALLQTPEFVEEFILDRTLDPALNEFGLTPGETLAATAPSENRTPKTENLFKLIDPACGSGHFLLAAFPRILNRWQRQEPGTNVRELVQRTLDSIHGVDINPFAIAIARFRLLLAAMRACGVTRLVDAPAFRMNLVCGDSLLHVPLKSGGNKFTKGQREFDAMVTDADGEVDHAYLSEDLPALKRILRPNQYHAVVANPPYIVPKDRALNEQYRNRFESCHMKYSLAAPFMELLFRLAASDGYTGQITANSFMKREFGKKLIESFLPTIDLTHVIDTSGAYIPGHGTPTVVLFGRTRLPVANTIRTVMGIRGEPSTPDNPSRGLVWSAVVSQVDHPRSQSEFVSVADSQREQFHKHPWSIGGGGAAELKEQLEQDTDRLGEFVAAIGVLGISGTNDAMVAPNGTFRRSRVEAALTRRFVIGDEIRDWDVLNGECVFFPYIDSKLANISSFPGAHRWMWKNRTTLGNRATFSKRTYFEEARPWWEWHQLSYERLTPPRFITLALVATNNQFVYQESPQLYSHSAIIVKLSRESTTDDHLSLLGLLNSSTACFWMQQTMHNKGGPGGGSTKDEKWHDFFEFSGTRLNEFPLPNEHPTVFTRIIDELSAQRHGHLPDSLVTKNTVTRAGIESAQKVSQAALGLMVALQEELDWECYRLYGLITEDLTINNPPAINVGQRAFEIVMARQIASGKLQTKWFDWLHCAPITVLPMDWPEDYRQLVQRRIELIDNDPNIRLIEQTNCKRRWEMETWDSQLERALCNWLLNRLESYFDFDGRMTAAGQGSGVGDQGESQEDISENRKLKTENPHSLASIQLYSLAKLADVASKDADFMQVAELYRDDPAFNVLALVEELVAAETVPLLPIVRYKDSGLRKREEWEKTWDLQREEDRLEAERQAANERIQKAAAAVRERFADQKHELDALEQKVRDCCLSVRDKYAPKLDFGSHQSPSVMYRLLGTGSGVAYEGGAAMAVLKDWTEEFENKSSSFETLMTEARKNDPEYQAALAAHAAIPPNPKIAVPPKYTSADFISTGGARYWALRGKLDVPKERWISFPGAEAEDGSLMICWAGYDHLQQAQAISAWYVEIRDQQGGHNDKRLIPLLACLLELLPWIKQWHNSSDNEFNMAMGDFFEGFIKEESRQLPRPATEPVEPAGEGLYSEEAAVITYGWSLPEIVAWKPSARRAAKRASKKAAKKSAAPKKAAKKRGKKTDRED